MMYGMVCNIASVRGQARRGKKGPGTEAKSRRCQHYVYSVKSSRQFDQIRALQSGYSKQAPTLRAHLLRNHHPNSSEP
jgi:hypothetical protein